MSATTDALKTDSRNRLAVRAAIQALGMLPILILLGLLFQVLSGYAETGDWATAWASGRFLGLQNLSIVAQQAAINTVLAAGMTFVILTGGIDLSVGSILACAAMVSVIASKIPAYGLIGIPAALAMGLGLGLANGILIAFFRLPPFIVTLGSLTAVRGLARLIGNDQTVFNSTLPFAGLAEDFPWKLPFPAYVDGTVGVLWVSIPTLAIIALGVVIVAWLVLRRTVLGVHIYAVGGNSDAARLSGIKVWRVLLFVYGMAGALAGLGGIMAAAKLHAANGLQLGSSYELDAIAAVVLGGTSLVGGIGSIWGTLIGAVILAVLSNGLILVGVSDIWQYIVKGFVIIGAVALDRYRLKGSART